MYNYIKKLIKKIIPLFYFPQIILLIILGRIKYKYLIDCWLICEREDEAKDNGFTLFEYINNENIYHNTYYVINSSSKDYDKVNNIGKTISYGSMEHRIALLFSKCILTTHYHSLVPFKYCDYKTFIKLYKIFLNNKKAVFLQHGITQNNVSDYLGKSNTQFDLFICGAKKEYEYIKDNFGYEKDEVVYTGFSRFDKLHNKIPKEQICLIPTWRSYLACNDTKDFVNSEYYINLQLLINNEKLIKLLEENDLDLYFYLHPNMQRFINEFKCNSKRIIIVDKEGYEIQDLLINSKLLITDYSSVFFDFSYMNKPVLFYQFDRKLFYSRHYQQGYYDFFEDGFGEVCENSEICVKKIEEYININFKLKKKYEDRINNFFELRDELNNERIIKELLNKIV